MSLNPTTIAGLKLWLKADAGVYTDSAGTTPASVGDRVGRWSDQSGNNYHATQGTANSRPQLATGLNGMPVVIVDPVGTGNPWRMALDASLSVAARDCAIFFNGVIDNLAPLEIGSGSQATPYFGSDQLNYYAGGVGQSRKIAGNALALAPVAVVARTGATTITLHGKTYALSAATAATPTGGNLFYSTAFGGGPSLKRVSGNGLPAQFQEILIYSPAPSASDVTAILAYLQERALSQDASFNVVFDGDSLTFGYQSAFSGGNAPVERHYPTQLANPSWRHVAGRNIGVAGQTLAQCNSNFATRGAIQYDNTNYPGKNYVVIWGGTNDIYVDAQTGAQAFARLQTYAATVKAAGFKVIACNMISRGQFNSTQEGYRQDFNAAFAADSTTFDGGRVFLDSQPGIGGVGAYSNATYFDTDQIHLTTAGYGIVAAAVRSVLLPGTIPQLERLTRGLHRGAV